MQLTSFLSLAVLAATTAATPLDPALKLEARAPYTNVNCGGQAIPSDAVRAAFNALIANGRKPEVDRPRNGNADSYPHYYGAADPSVRNELNGICPLGANQQYWEFPLLRVDGAYTGGYPGAYRVIARGKAEASPANGYTYCLSAYHPPGGGNGFLPCQVTA